MRRPEQWRYSGVDDRPRFREYVVRQHQPSYRYSEELRVGAVLPERAVSYYDVPAEYHAPGTLRVAGTSYGVFPALSIVGGVLAVLALVLIKAAAS